MGTAFSKSPTDSQDIRSRFNFSGIKDLTNHPYLSCICTNPDSNLHVPEIRNLPMPSSQRSSQKSISKDKVRSSSKALDSSFTLFYGGNRSSGVQSNSGAMPNTERQKMNSLTVSRAANELFFNPSRSSYRNSSVGNSKRNADLNPIVEKIENENLETVFEGAKSVSNVDVFNKSEIECSKEFDESLVYSMWGKDEMGKVDDGEEVVIEEGRRYRGDLLDGVPHGRGKEIWPDGSSYEGMYQFGARTGEGVLVWSDGSKYRGSFLNNEMHGFGIFDWSNGNKYEGMWSSSKMHGEGKYTWSNGNQFVGSYFKGLKHGDGTFIYHNGRIVKGKWLNGHIQVNI